MVNGRKSPLFVHGRATLGTVITVKGVLEDAVFCRIYARRCPCSDLPWGLNALKDLRVILPEVSRIAMRQLYCAVLLISAICAVSAQEADTSLKFEVASVKASAPPTVDPHILAMRTPPDPPGRFTRRDIPLSTLIVMAYRLKQYEYAGPSWLTSARFDIMAKVPEGAAQAQQMVMLQNLLAERFGLKVHREEREMPVYELVIAKGGPKFKVAAGVIRVAEIMSALSASVAVRALDGPHDFMLGPGDARAAALDKSRTECTKDVGHLKGGPAHFFCGSGLRSTARPSASSGLVVARVCRVDRCR